MNTIGHKSHQLLRAHGFDPARVRYAPGGYVKVDGKLVDTLAARMVRHQLRRFIVAVSGRPALRHSPMLVRRAPRHRRPTRRQAARAPASGDDPPPKPDREPSLDGSRRGAAVETPGAA